MKRYLRASIIVIIANFVYSFGVAFFIEPSGLIMGGTTGIGLFLNNAFGINTSISVLIMNTILFLIGWAVMGKLFAFNTLVSTFVFPVALAIAESCAKNFTLTDDIFICTFFGGIIIGGALAVVIRTGASTGGMDIPPIVINHYTGLSLSGLMWAFDIVILLVQALFTDSEKVLYGIVLVIIYTVVLDKAMVVGKSKTELIVISEKHEEIKSAILHDLDRGVTILNGRTGYLAHETEVVLSVVSTRELPKAEQFIHEIDPNAFIIISRVSEVRGRGFDRQKRYL